MKKYTLLYSAVVALALVSCDYNEDNFDGFEDFGKPTDIKKGNITFTDWASLKGNPKTNQYFSAADEAQDYLPNWLAGQYPSADEGSSFKITFDYKEEKSEKHDKYYNIDYYKLKDDDYKIIHGKGYYGAYLNKSTTSKLYKVLNEVFPDAKEGSHVFAEYNYNADAIPQKMDDPVFSYDFESLETGDVTSIKNWYISATGGAKWSLKSYNDNQYISYSANGKGACEAWLVTPSVEIEDENNKFAFEVCVGYWNADCLSVLISTDFDGKDVSKAKWTDITSSFDIPQEPSKGYGTLALAGTFNLTDYVGKNVNIAFKYVGNGDDEKITVMTVHSAKGLEFRNVFVVGMEETLFPGSMVGDSSGALEEERRLFYVAITRAEEHCFLSYARTRFRYGKMEFGSPSRFLKDIDIRFLRLPQDAGIGSKIDEEAGSFRREHSGGFSRSPHVRESLYNTEKETPQRSKQQIIAPSVPRNLKRVTPATSSSTPTSASVMAVQPGQLIEHERFGLGEVMKVEGQGDNAKATIHFKNAGDKQLLLRFARFKIIG